MDQSTAQVTFVIPVSSAHQPLLQRALDSIKAQTVPCDVAARLDSQGAGPGAIRNRLLATVRTPFVSFLDADDWIEPTFAEETLAAYRGIGGGQYVFTDWLDNQGKVVQTPCLNGPDGYPISVPDRKPYCGGTWHVLTTLIPTAWAREIGGFDETLPGFEDTDFYLKLCASHHCGFHLNRALFHYAANGGRALAFLKHPEHEQIKAGVAQRYGGRMGCCGDEQKAAIPVGSQQEGDVLAMALWHGNRGEVGRVTRRLYPRISFPRTAWVDPQDVAQSPALWKAVERPPDGDLQRIAQVGLASVVQSKPAPPQPVMEATSRPITKPDVARVIRLGQKAGEPIFVFSEKDYPSYADIKRLVQLSGFDSVTTKKIDAFSRRPLIVVSPESLPDLSGIQARVICWQLEYAGDYTHNYDGFTGEVWASDKAWADEHGAKYVLMGSHPGLAGARLRKMEYDYDVTMLGYMTPRRQSVKAAFSDLRWPEDYPGHDTQARADILWCTRLMLHVHQHDNAPFVAPQRLALAATYHMPVLSEATPGLGEDLRSFILTVPYDLLVENTRHALQSSMSEAGERFHQYLCIDHPFRTCVMEALKAE